MQGFAFDTVFRMLRQLRIDTTGAHHQIIAQGVSGGKRHSHPLLGVNSRPPAQRVGLYP